MPVYDAKTADKGLPSLFAIAGQGVPARFQSLGLLAGETSIEYQSLAKQEGDVNRLAPAAMFDLMAA